MFEVEVWKAIPGHEGLCEASSLGRIRSLVPRKQNRIPAGIIRPSVRKDGYLSTHLKSVDGRIVNWLIHRAVLSAFHGVRTSAVHGAHFDGCKTNNRLDNLAWCTPKENASHKVIHGTVCLGERNGMAELSAATVLEIRSEYRKRSRTRGCLPLARRYGLSFQHVADIVARRRWTHV